jgi:hypothetical protein
MLFKEIIAVYCMNLQNLQVYSVGKVQNYWSLKQVLRVVNTGLKG